MFLEYGIDDHGDLVHIDAMSRGRTPLMCPYCGVLLVAKKGLIKAPHFAHESSTCAASVSGHAALPAFDRFDLHVPAKVMAQLRRFAGGHTGGLQLWKLRDSGLIEKNDTGRFELTTRGQVPLGHLPLALFLGYQETAFLDRYRELEAEARTASMLDIFDHLQISERHRRLTDLRLYRAQWRRLLQSTLYFIEVTHASENWPSPLYKIGVTTRDLVARCAEIERDLRPHLGPTTLTILGTWPHRGSVEFYFKHRYQKQQHRIGHLTEYFLFLNLQFVLSSDLRHISPKTLSPFDQGLINDSRLDFEQEHAAERGDLVSPDPLSP